VVGVKPGLGVAIAAGVKDDDYSEVGRAQLVAQALEVGRKGRDWRDKGNCVAASSMAAVCVSSALIMQGR